MNAYDSQYYIIHKPKGRDDLPFLSPDENTENRNFNFEKQLVGSPPLVFENGSKEYNTKRDVKSVKVLPDILFSGTDLVIRSHIREKLLNYNFPHMHMHPTVYIHDNGKWHEDYWYMTFTEEFDCWSRENSDYEQDDPPIRLGGFELYQVYNYSLNEELLDKVPLEQRLLFKMGGSLDAFIICHQKLLGLFQGDGKNGAKLTPIHEY